jgi:hypothetical protein
MWLGNLKLIAALLALSLIGTGAGVLTVRVPSTPGGPTGLGQVSEQATQPTGVDGTGRGVQGKTDAKEVAVQLKTSQAELQKLDAEYHDLEQTWMQDVMDRRKELIIAEERLRFVERRHNEERERERTDEDWQAKDFRQRLTEAGRNLQEARRTLTGEALAKSVQQLQEVYTDTQQQLQNLREGTVRRRAEAESRRGEEVIQARLTVANAEELLNQQERSQSMQQARIRANMQALEDRIRRLQGLSDPAPSSTATSEALERKVDQLLREVNELRRQLRRQEPEPGRAPGEQGR